MDNPVIRRYRHGNVPNAMRTAVREMLEQGDPDNVGLRDAARRVGVSSTAAYRHFLNKEHLLVSVAAEGFSELVVAMDKTVPGADPLLQVGLAYLDYAMRHQGLFRLMFGPLLAERGKYAILDTAASAAFDRVKRVAGEAASTTILALLQGLASLVLASMVDHKEAHRLLAPALKTLRSGEGDAITK